MRHLLVCVVAVVINVAALAAPDKTGWASGERAQGSAADIAKKMTYGMCSAPQNADAYPGSAQKIVVHDCNDFSQQFVVTAAKPAALSFSMDARNSSQVLGGSTPAFSRCAFLYQIAERSP